MLKRREAHLPQLYADYPEHKEELDEYMRISDKILNGTPIFLLTKLLPLWLQRICWRLFLRDFAKYSGRPAIDVLRELISSKKLISLLCGLWIDTGARPDTGSFFLMASVFRGLPKGEREKETNKAASIIKAAFFGVSPPPSHFLHREWLLSQGWRRSHG